MSALSHSTIDGYLLNYILVDNSCEENVVNQHSNLLYIYNNGNIGIAAAQNRGVETAKSLGCDYVLFFDQDSEYEVDMVAKMVAEYRAIKQYDSHIAMLGPLIVDKETSQVYKNSISTDTIVTKVDTIISSGSIVEVATFDIVGNMDEKLFIDLVDHEWCWRAKQRGYNCYQSSSVVLQHKVGNCSRTLCGYPIIISAPFRYYYKYRNLLWLLRRSYVPFGWKVKSVVRKIIELLCVPVMAKDRTIYSHIFRGIKDGLK